MIVVENLKGGLTRTYSDAGFYIHGGDPEGDYAEAIDYAGDGHTYVETDRLLDGELDATADDYEDALARLGVE